MRRAPLPNVEAEASIEEETESGGKPTPIDAPIALKMEIGNTAFTCAGQDPIDLINRSKGENYKITPPTKLEF